MIEKRYPRKLNKSIDSRLLAPDEMSDAINISTGEDTRGSGGNAGVLKPIKSNTPLNEGFAEFADGNKNVVGKVMCDKYNVIYFFVNDAAGDNGIYAYDPDEYLPGSGGSNGLTKVYVSSTLAYNASSFVKADITYIPRNYVAEDETLYEDVPFIFFTDNNSQPKKINVLRAIEGDYDGNSELDFLLACHKTPVHEITGSFLYDAAINTNEFLGIEGFQFAYQTVYRDGSESAISSYSDVFVPPGYLTYYGQADVQILNQQNTIKLTVPSDDFSSEVESFKILMRRGDSGSWFLVEEIDWDQDTYADAGYLYYFTNNSIGTALSGDQQSKQFDNLPLRAETQTIIDNRLVYGNYVDGFDLAEVDAVTFEPVHSERPEDFKTYDITALPSTSPAPGEYFQKGQNKNVGFTIDASSLTSNIEEGSFVSFSFTLNPKNNFHVYNVRGTGYHQSPQMGEDFDNEGLRAEGIGTYEDFGASSDAPTGGSDFFGSLGADSLLTGHPKGFWWQNAEKSGATFIKEQFDNYGGIPAVCSGGVTSALDQDGNTVTQHRFKWRHFDMLSGQSSISDISDVDFGTSAGNPFVVQGKPVKISCSFTAKKDLTPTEVVDTIARILAGELQSRDPDSPNEIDLLADNISYPEGLEYSIDLGLNNGSSARETSPIADLITMVGTRFNSSQIDEGFGLGKGSTTSGGGQAGFGEEGEATGGGGTGDEEEITTPQDSDIIKGFFVLNKANVQFGMFRDEVYEEDKALAVDQHPDILAEGETVSERNGEPRARFGVYIKEITVPDDEESILSCMRRPLPGARWWFFAPWNSAGNDNTPAVDNVLLGDADFREYSLFPFTQDDGSQAGGLQVNPSFAQALGHNIDRPVAPQSRLGLSAQSNPDSEDDEYIFIENPIEGFNVQSESSVFRQEVFKGPSQNEQPPPPWKSVLGGLYYSPVYKDLVSSEQGREIKFFEGEAPGGVSRFSLMDGKGGPGGSGTAANSVYDNYVLYAGSGPKNKDFLRGIGTFGSAPIFGISNIYEGFDGEDLCLAGAYGPALSNNIFIGADTDFYADGNRKNPSFIENGKSSFSDITTINGTATVNPIYLQTSIPLIHLPKGGPTFFSYQLKNAFIDPRDFSEEFGEDPFKVSLDDSLYESKVTNPNANAPTMLVVEPGSGGLPTFKAGASHPFGVVFYDSRGRCSNVTPLGSAYVPWYSERSSGFEGPTGAIKCTITGSAPEEATSFRFVYGGNTTVSNFTQYSTGGAFTSEASDDVFGGNIYVSLNHLQFSPASYVKSYGARGLDGSQEMYTYREGDRLRIISYYENAELRIFAPDSYEFNIVDQVVLSTGDDNPLYSVDSDGNVPHPAKTGSFLVLENNINALGFTYDDVKEGDNEINTESHYWGKRCVVEIYSPKTSQDEEALLYYEMGDVLPITDFGTATAVDIEGGDVWWKTAPVNFQKITNLGFGSIITEDSADPNFFPYNLEAKSFSDKVRNSDVWGKGKPKIYLPDVERSVKMSSLTYSDKNNPLSKVLSLTSFNPSKGQFKDLPAEFGDINYLINNDDSIFVIQSSRCSSVPVNRNLITDGGGTESLVAARQVLGTERYYAGNYGCDNNPESVCNIGNTVYFASKSNRQVYKFNPSSGIEVISDAGMKTYFKKLFEQAEIDRDAGQGDIKVVGGYDPYADTYILSVYNQNVQEGTCGENDFVSDGSEGGGPVVTETVTEYVYPDSVTISLASLLSRFEDGQLFDLAGATVSANVSNFIGGSYGTITGSGVNDGTIGVNDLLRFLTLYGNQLEGPAEDLQTFNPSDDDVFFNFPDQPEE
jgi:hypothetical protein